MIRYSFLINEDATRTLTHVISIPFLRVYDILNCLWNDVQILVAYNQWLIKKLLFMDICIAFERDHLNKSVMFHENPELCSDNN